MRFQRERLGNRQDRISDAKLRTTAEQFLASLRASLNSGSTNIAAPEWARTREILADLSRQRASQGFSPTETATFVFSFKEALFTALQAQLATDPHALAQESRRASELLDQLGLYTTEVFQKSREDVIIRQQQEMLELSTPVVQLWEGILALPLIGTLDSNRTQIVMQNLLEAIVKEGADLAIVDITGVPTVDTLVAQHLLKTVAAARLMGADCIISGIRPQIAQTIIHLGVDLSGVLTKATLAEAFRLALKKKSLTITKA
jgi:rsbT co-antagonist protein RsbR